MKFNQKKMLKTLNSAPLKNTLPISRNITLEISREIQISEKGANSQALDQKVVNRSDSISQIVPKRSKTSAEHLESPPETTASSRERERQRQRRETLREFMSQQSNWLNKPIRVNSNTAGVNSITAPNGPRTNPPAPPGHPTYVISTPRAPRR